MPAEQHTRSVEVVAYVVDVHRDCGHVFKSDVRWNTAAAAQRHGAVLASLACSTCRDAR